MVSTRVLLSPSERERILRAMIELCAKQGYVETTIKEVVERADASEEAFDELFGSKENCMLSAHNAILGEVIAIIGASYSADRSEWDSVIVGTKALLEFMAANPTIAQIGYITSRQMGPPLLRQSYEAGVRAVTAMVDRGREYSDSSDQPTSAARAALGGAEALVRREIMAGRGDRLPELLPTLVYAVTVPFLGQEEALGLARRTSDDSGRGGD